MTAALEPTPELDIAPHRSFAARPNIATNIERAAQSWARHAGLRATDGLSLVSSAMVFASPWSMPEELALPVELIVWIVNLDDFVQATSAQETRHTAQRLFAVLDGSPADADLPTAVALADLRDRLQPSPLWQHLGQVWSHLLRQIIQGTVDDRTSTADLATRHTGAAPDDYFSSDIPTLSAVLHTSWIAAGDRLVLEHHELLTTAAYEAQIAVRLTNDLRRHLRAGDDQDLTDLAAADDGIAARVREALDRRRALLRPLVRQRIKPALVVDRSLELASMLALTVGSGRHRIPTVRT